MSILFDIRHVTEYRYHRRVEFGEHRIMFRPRDSHDLRVLATDLKISPGEREVRMIQDVYSNSIALVKPQSPAASLKIECSFTVEHTGSRALDLPLDPGAMQYPFAYSAEDSFALQHYLAPFYDDPTGELAAWARQFANPGAGTREPLVKMNKFIRDSMKYIARDEEGVQTPYDTIRGGTGTCRDFATLMIEAVRRLGYAARFVSGYLYTPSLDDGKDEYSGAGATHAWVQVYLPGAGWIPFDPTNNLIGGTDLIRVGVARHASLASPVRGEWKGAPADYAGMSVEVKVHRRRTGAPAPASGATATSASSPVSASAEAPIEAAVA
jgi:transglutaminase-like putative cysteine protease